MQNVRLLFGQAFTLILLSASTVFGQVCIDTFPYIQDFEMDNGGWSASSITSNGLGPVTWTWSNPNNPVINSASSGSRCWITSNNPFTLPPLQPYAHAPNEYSAVVSPCFDFSNLQNPGVKVNIWWESEWLQDGTVLQSSIDSGATWQRVGAFQAPIFWYNADTIAGGVSGPGGQLQGWSGTDATGTSPGAWVEAQQQLTGLAGQPRVMFRFAFAADAGTAPGSLNDGFAFDDFTIGDMPVVSLGADTTVCFADTVFWNVCSPNAVSYQWNTNPFDTLCTNIGVASGTYVVSVTDSAGFVARDTVSIIVSTTSVFLGGDQLICPEDTITLNALNPGAIHLWLPDSSTNQTLEIWEAGTYTVQVSDNLGCLETDSVTVSIDVVPVVDLGPDTTFCAGESIILDAGSANPGTQYDWNPISANTQTVFVSSPGLYTVLVTTPAGCLTGDSVNVEVKLAPVVELGMDRTECGIFTLDAGNPGAHFQWSTGDTTQLLQTDIGNTYFVTVTNDFDCIATDTVTISAGFVPQVDVGPDQVICDDEPVTLDAGLVNQSYFWSTGDSSQTISVDIPGTYVVEVITGDECSGFDTVEVVESALAVDLGPDITICDGDSVLLDATTNGTNYLWDNGIDIAQRWLSTAGTYSVVVTDFLDCAIEDEVLVSVQPEINVDFSLGNPPVLQAPVTFNDQSSGNPTSWYWDFGDGNTSTDQNPTHTYLSLGSFDVCLTVEDGACIYRH
ncbi:MAG: PKD domain-containing protein, partial [Bacteroidota bacterium]